VVLAELEKVLILLAQLFFMPAVVAEEPILVIVELAQQLPQEETAVADLRELVNPPVNPPEIQEAPEQMEPVVAAAAVRFIQAEQQLLLEEMVDRA
jgi:hypothetical protein